MSAALLPCPFCGEKESLYVRHVEGTILHPAYFVACDNCGAQGATTDKGDHKKEWNARGIAPPVAAGSVDTIRTMISTYRHLPKIYSDEAWEARKAHMDAIMNSIAAWGAQQREVALEFQIASHKKEIGHLKENLKASAQAFRERAEKAEAELAHKQAIIDRLMLEYCPDEMTAEQVTEWASHQKRAE